MGIGNFSWGTPRYTTLVNNGLPSQRLDIAIMGDGYAAEEMPLFYEDADSIVDAFSRWQPMKAYFKHFNFHRVDTIAPTSGVADRWAEPPIKKRSPLGTFFSPLADRRLVGPDPWVWHVANRSGVPWDSVLVVVNTPRRGGATLFTMGIGYASRNSADFPGIMVHEAGHSIAKLMDEYVDPLIPDLKFLRGRSLPNWILPFANVTTNGKKPKWIDWVSEEVACPSDPNAHYCAIDTVGAFEGASYVSFGAYKPTQHCMMKTGYREGNRFCPVCTEQWIKRIYRRSDVADSFSPAYERGQGRLRVKVGEVVRFSADILRPRHIYTRWRVRKAHEFGWDVHKISHGFEDFELSFDRPTTATVELTLQDHDPRLRKQSVIRSTRQVKKWQLLVEK